jgi:hypothetical protein
MQLDKLQIRRFPLRDRALTPHVLAQPAYQAYNESRPASRLGSPEAQQLQLQLALRPLITTHQPTAQNRPTVIGGFYAFRVMLQLELIGALPTHVQIIEVPDEPEVIAKVIQGELIEAIEAGSTKPNAAALQRLISLLSPENQTLLLQRPKPDLRTIAKVTGIAQRALRKEPKAMSEARASFLSQILDAPK